MKVPLKKIKKNKKKERKKVWDRWEGTHYKGFFWEMGEHIFLEIKLRYNIVRLYLGVYKGME